LKKDPYRWLKDLSCPRDFRRLISKRGDRLMPRARLALIVRIQEIVDSPKMVLGRDDLEDILDDLKAIQHRPRPWNESGKIAWVNALPKSSEVSVEIAEGATDIIAQVCQEATRIILDRFNGNKTLTARALGISLRTVRNWNNEFKKNGTRK